MFSRLTSPFTGGLGPRGGDWGLPFIVKLDLLLSVVLLDSICMIRTRSSVAFSVAPPLDVVAPLVTVGCVVLAVTSFVSRKGFLETGRAAPGPLTGLVAPEPTLLRKGLFEARGEETRSEEILAIIDRGGCWQHIARAVAAMVRLFAA